MVTWRINPICLTPFDLAYYGETAEVIGWGKEKSKAKAGSPVLRYTSLKGELIWLLVALALIVIMLFTVHRPIATII